MIAASRARTGSLALVLVAVAALAQDREEERFRRQREALVAQLASERWTGGEPVRNARVLEALRRVPRHRLVPPEQRPHAYEDRPLPIGYGQTISQPYVVARMTELLDPQPTDRVLEVGTGSGYQAAVLAELVAEVFTIEIVEPLGRQAEQRLRELGYANIHVRIGDGYLGWPEQAPFDAVIVTAAPDHIPEPLLEQLKPGGRMVIPVGARYQTQELLLITKGAKGPRDIRIQRVMPVIFVPLVRPGERP
ncbi:MAG: protein-L-isoaspartate(D-aspartate) O-methyltransferase [Acidobacteriia bacterium]|jgi:protein-L-isoaspartate(D-aspartate) O-methyltransferase|nr:protein-L-isoaspartate(D-aspartate) O-methyltransferase [Terriglobia bacterium]